MLRLSLRTLSSSLTPSRYLPPYSISIARCSTSPHPHLSYPPHSHGDPDPRNVRVSVWWNLDKCYVPAALNVSCGVQAITAAIESSGIKGPIQIKAFGDMLRLARTDQEALSSTASTAIDFTDIPHDGDCSAHSSLFDGLGFWVSQNPPPAHLFLIIADEGSSSILYRLLYRLRIKKYNILLALKEPDPAVQWSAATIMWNWGDLVTGENLTGRHFNQPPIDSWYGHYELPLEDPFTALQHEVFSQDSFWRDLQTFINTDIGSFILAEGRTREQMAFHLQVYGPSVLKYVTKGDLFLLVDKLTSEEKWVLESPYLRNRRPFKLRIHCDSDNELVYSDASYSDVLCFLVLLCFLVVYD